MISSIFLIISNNATSAVYKDSLLIKPATKKDFHLSSRTMEISKDGVNDEEDMFNRVAKKGIARFGSIPYNHLFTKGGQVGLNNDRDGLRVDNKWRDSDIETNISFLLVANSYNRIMINDLCLKFDDPDIKITECPGIDDKYDEMKKFEWIIESYIRKEDLERCKELSKRAEDKKENAEKELGLDKKKDEECDINEKTKECELEKKDTNIKQNKEDEENLESTENEKKKEKNHDTNKKEPSEKSNLPTKENKKMEDEEVLNEESVEENKIEEEKDLDNKNKTHAPNKKTHHKNEEPDKSFSENDQKPSNDTNDDNRSFNANNEIIEEPLHSPQLSQQHPQQNNLSHPQSSQLNHQPSQQYPSSSDTFPQEPVSHPQTQPTNKMHSQLNPQLKPNKLNDDFPLSNNLNNQKDPENLENIEPNDKERYPPNNIRNQNNGKTYGGMQTPPGEYDTPQHATPNDDENKRYPPNNNTNNSSIDRNDSAKIVNLLQKLVENNQNTNMLNEDSDTEKNDNLDAIYRFLHESVNDFNQYKKRNNYDQ
ncbi:hypothetical protein COBT_001013 [Conglomerata obtusa]